MKPTGRITVFLALSGALAACGSKPQVNETNATVEEVSQSVREASNDRGLVRPGKWVSTVSIDSMAMPAIPPAAAEQVQRELEQSHRSEICLTAEDAKEPNAKFFSGNAQCRYDHFTMRGGKIDATMRCSSNEGTQVMEMTGSYSPDAYRMHMKATTEDADPGAAVVMQMTLDARRVGDCSAKESRSEP